MSSGKYIYWYKYMNSERYIELIPFLYIDYITSQQDNASIPVHLQVP